MLRVSLGIHRLYTYSTGSYLGSHPPEKRIAALTREVNSLPEPNYKTLKVLIKHLAK